MPDVLQAAMLRRWAMDCAAQAANSRYSDEQRERLLKMREALLDLATTQDWLDGYSPREDLKAGANACIFHETSASLARPR